MGKTNPRVAARMKRKLRIRKSISGTPDRPRLCVFRSSKHIYAQVIDDTKGYTIASASTLDVELRSQGDTKKKKVEKAVEVGKLIAKKAKENGVTKVVFDRNGYLYHGRVKAVSDGARENGLEF
jgi:large subunit ribosomal protein L18